MTWFNFGNTARRSFGILLAGLIGTLAGFSPAPEAHAADWNVTNHVAVSARLGFNLSASFKGMGGAAGGASTRRTPDGTPYNYDDGYVLTDVSGNAGGLTWNWGYDDSAGQVSGNSILLHRTTSTSGATDGDLDGSDPFLGGEISFISQFGARESFRYGFEAAVNFLPFDFDGRSVAQAMSSVTTDAYPFTPGTTPPTATTGAPYQGTYGGPGFVIGDTPVSSTTAMAPGATLTADNTFEGNLWGGRLGPYIEFPFGQRFSLYGSAGLAVGYVDSELSWTETVTVTGGGTSISEGSSSESDLLLGAYGAIQAAWHFSERLSLLGGVQYQYLQDYEHEDDGRSVELELDSAIYGTLGLMYNF